MARDTELDDIYARDKSIDALGADPDALGAVKWDNTDTKVEADGRTIVTGFDQKTGRSVTLKDEAPADVAAAPQSFIRQDIEDGVSWDMEVRPDGSEWLIGRTGAPRTGIMTRWKGPTANVTAENGGRDAGPLDGTNPLPAEGKGDAAPAAAALPEERGTLTDMGVGAVHGFAKAIDEIAKTTRLSDVGDWLEKQFPLGTIDIPAPQGTAGEVVSGLSQTIAGMIPAARATRALGAVSSLLRWTAAGAVSDFAAFSPDDPGIGEMAKELGKLDSPVLEEVRTTVADALAKDEDDGELVKRLKNVGGGALTGVLLDGLGIAYKAARGLKKAAPELAAELSGAAPGVKVAAADLGDFGGDVPAMRAAARKAYDTILKTTPAQHPELGEVRFSNAGRKKFFNASADPRKLAMVPQLREILEGGELVRTDPHRPKNSRDTIIKNWHWLENDVVVDGEPLRVGMYVFEDNNGKLFYDLTQNVPVKGKGADPVQHNKAGGGAPSSDALAPDGQNVAPKDDGLNLFILGPAAAAAGGDNGDGKDPQIQMAGFLDKLARPLIGKAGREALDHPRLPKPAADLPAGARDIIAQPFSPGEAVAQGDLWKGYREGTPEGIDFNLKNLDTTDQVKAQINNVSRAYAAKTAAQTKGVIPQALTRQVADMLGADPEAAERAIKSLPVDTEDLHVRALVMRDALVKSAEGVDSLAVKIAGQPDQVTDTELLAFREALASHAALQANMKGVQTEIARALASFRIPAGGGAMQRAQMAGEVLNATGGRDSAMELARRWMETPADLKGKFVEKGAFAKTRDAVYEIWINGLLSSPRTHEVNLASNLLFTAWQVPERVVAGAVGATRRAITGSDEGARMGEAVALLHGFAEAIPDAFRLAWQTFKDEAPASGGLAKIEAQQRKNISSVNFGLSEDSLPGKFVDYVGMGVRMPGRFLMTADEFQKAIAQRGELRAQAYRLSNQAADQGKTTKEAADVYADVMTGQNAAANEATREFADMVTFTREMGEAGKAIQNFASKVPMARVILPFIRTPMNIIKETIARTPAAPILREVRRDLMEGGAKADLAVSKIVTGSAAMTFAGSLAASGTITGGGPKDAKLRAAWLQKYQPYSFTPDGGKTWYPYGRLEPIGTLFGIAADFVEFSKWTPHDLDQADEDALATRAVAAVLQTVGDKTFLQGLGDAAAAYQDPGRYMERFLANLTASAVPSVVRDVENATDAARRDTRRDPYEKNPLAAQFEASLNEVKARTPGWSDDMPPATNFWGEDLKAFEGDWWQAFNAFAPKTKNPQAIDNELLRMRYPLSEPSRQVEGVKLDPKQFYTLKKTMNELPINNPATGAPQNFREYLNWLVGSAAYQAIPGDVRKMEVLRDVRNRFVDAASQRMITPGSKEFDADLFGSVVRMRAMSGAGAPGGRP
jgi:hypothetical protein